MTADREALERLGIELVTPTLWSDDIWIVDSTPIECTTTTPANP